MFKIMLPTPSTSHVNYSRVYEPAEDSYLVLDTLASPSETEFLRDRFPPETASPLALEVGTGSGVVLAFVTANALQLFGRSDIAALGMDINPFACAASHETIGIAVAKSSGPSSRCGAFLDVVNGDLAAAIRPGSVDVLIFNPPYVPSEVLPAVPDGAFSENATFERDTRLLALSTDGGVDGMEVTVRLLAQLDSVLSSRGVAYILLCAQNKPDDVVDQLLADPAAQGPPGLPDRWGVSKIASSGNKAGWERLCIIRIWRNRGGSG